MFFLASYEFYKVCAFFSHFYFVQQYFIYNLVQYEASQRKRNLLLVDDLPVVVDDLPVVGDDLPVVGDGDYAGQDQEADQNNQRTHTSQP